jgi:hypothetical protein
VLGEELRGKRQIGAKEGGFIKAESIMGYTWIGVCAPM